VLHRDPCPRPRPARGFTILEFVISMVAVALLAAWLIPAYFAQPEVTLKSAAELLREDLRIARTLATTEQQDLEMVFGPRSYELRHGDQLVIHPRNGRPFRVDFARDAVFEGVGDLQLMLEEGDRIRFSANGYFASGGAVNIPFSDRWRQVCLDTELQQVEVSEETGLALPPPQRVAQQR
jgi:prepilin-type N-terminal cleavage/methylation domain-containing protein